MQAITFNYAKLKIFFLKIFIILIVDLISGCEGNEIFYRPNVPEKLCSIGIINVDDTSDYYLYSYPLDSKPIVRFISFEKSFQSEYSRDLNDSLREFSFSIYSSEKELFSYHSDSTIKDLNGFEIPGNIDFHSGEKYFLRAEEKSTPEFSAFVTVPDPPSEPKLISVIKEITQYSDPCDGDREVTTAIIDFSFENDSRKNLYYAILLDEIDKRVDQRPDLVNTVEYDLRECNTVGFFAELSGYTIYQKSCQNFKSSYVKVPVYAYFIDGSKIPDNKCVIKLSTLFLEDRIGFKEFSRTTRVRLLSIPKELFLFEKSLYTYAQNSRDPFSEPVYLNGNITGGNGIFAICRSKEFSIKHSLWQ
jgi:hypothetical protein